MKRSAGILAWKNAETGIEVLLVHPGGPFWKSKDAGSWSIPKGEVALDEDFLAAAKREFGEETVVTASGNFVPMAPVRLKSGKEIIAFAVEFGADLSSFRSNEFEIEWPPRSGRLQKFPEVDKAQYFPISIALGKINTGQAALLAQLQKLLLADS